MSTRHKDDPPALVLGIDVNGLGVVRSLGKEGVHVYGGYQTRMEIGRWSRYCEAVEVPPVSHPEELEEWLLGFGRRVGTAVLFVTSDQLVEFVVERWDTLSRYFRCPMPEPVLARRLLDKTGQWNVAREGGVLIPETYAPHNRAEFDAIAHLLPFPCIMKPEIVFKNPIPGTPKNLLFRDRKELCAFLDRCPEAMGRVILQEVIPGGDDCVFYSTLYLDENHKPLARFCAQKIRQYPPGFGITAYAISRQSDVMQRIEEEFLFRIGYRGLVDIEFKRDPRDGSLKFIELNMRSHWANSHSTKCGINLFFCAYLDQTGQLPEGFQVPSYRNGVGWIDFQGDAGAFWRGWCGNKISLSSWVGSIARARSFAVFDIADPLPFLFSSWKFLNILTTR